LDPTLIAFVLLTTVDVITLVGATDNLLACVLTFFPLFINPLIQTVWTDTVVLTISDLAELAQVTVFSVTCFYTT